MHYTFCPFCGTRYAAPESHHFHCQACGRHVYLNSKPTASTLILNEKNELLLGRRRIEPSKGMWDVIGGFLECGEHPEAGAIREAKEETGLDVGIVRQLLIVMDSYGEDGDATLNICYLVRPIGGTQAPGDDIAELAWFPAGDIPAEIAFDNGRRMIEEWKRTAADLL